MRGTSQAVRPCSHLSTPITPQIHKADNMQELESSLLQHCINIWFWEVCFHFSSVAPLLYVPRPARPQESCQDREDSLRKITGLSCFQSEKHLRPTALSLNHSSEQLTAVSSVRRATQKPLTGFKRELPEVLYYTLGKAAFWTFIDTLFQIWDWLLFYGLISKWTYDSPGLFKIYSCSWREELAISLVSRGGVTH